MSTTVNDLEKAVNSGLTTTVKRSEINFNQLIVTLDFQNLVPTILFLKTNSINFRWLLIRKKCFQIISTLPQHQKYLEIILLMQQNGLKLQSLMQ